MADFVARALSAAFGFAQEGREDGRFGLGRLRCSWSLLTTTFDSTPFCRSPALRTRLRGRRHSAESTGSSTTPLAQSAPSRCASAGAVRVARSHTAFCARFITSRAFASVPVPSKTEASIRVGGYRRDIGAFKRCPRGLRVTRAPAKDRRRHGGRARVDELKVRVCGTARTGLVLDAQLSYPRRYR